MTLFINNNKLQDILLYMYGFKNFADNFNYYYNLREKDYQTKTNKNILTINYNKKTYSLNNSELISIKIDIVLKIDNYKQSNFADLK